METRDTKTSDEEELGQTLESTPFDPTTRGKASFGETNSRLRRLIRKELNEILRDRRTILTLVFMPLLLYPLMSIAFTQFFLVSSQNLSGQNVTILGFQTPKDQEDFVRWILARASDTPFRESFLPSQKTFHRVQPDIAEFVRLGEVDVVVVPNRERGKVEPLSWRLVYSQEYQRSLSLFLKFQKLFDQVNETNVTTPKAIGPNANAAPYKIGFLRQADYTKSRLLRRKYANQTLQAHLDRNVFRPAFPPEVPVKEIERAFQEGRLDLLLVSKKTDEGPIEWELRCRAGSVRSLQALLFFQDYFAKLNATTIVQPEPVTAKQSEFEFPIATLVPLILILMTITGAVYPAIDLTAGERERGTLEILIAAPVPRMGLLFAKYVSVLVVAMLTAFINLTMMIATIQVSGLSENLFGPIGLTYSRVAQLLALMLLFAGFFSAVLLMITSFARSFKEAQAYLVPVMLVSLAPGLASLFPSLALTPSLSMVPLLNIVLLARDLFQGMPDGFAASLVVGSTILYAATALCIAARIFGAEDVLYKEQTSWSDLVRPPHQTTTTPGVSNALVCLCLIFIVTFFAEGLTRSSTLPKNMSDAEIWIRQTYLVGMGVFVFAGLPWLTALYRRIEIRSGFRLSPLGSETPRTIGWGSFVIGCLAAITLGLTLWPFVLELLRFLRENSSLQLDEQQQKQLADTFRRLRSVIPVGVMIVYRVIPAVVEELFFRGFLFRSIEKVSKPWVAIVTCAVLFGLLHMISTPVFGFERFVPSTLLGLVLGIVAWRTRTVIAPMLMHATHNGLLVWLEYTYGSNGVGIEPEQNAFLFRPEFYALTGVGALVAFGLLFQVLRPENQSDSAYEE
ncbi:MAG: ABC transporter permease subunit [Gemmataceae bacterium]